LADAFSPALAEARAAYAAADATLTRERARLAGALAARIGPLPDSEEFIVMRDVLPDVPPGVRVVRETPAYRLLTLEHDPPAAAAAAARDGALARVALAEDEVRRDLAVAVAREGPALLAAARALGELDRTLARVAFTQHWGGCVPDLTAGAITFAQASFVPLRAALSEAALPYTPVSLELRGAAVLTGPNMGGKSAALATCGFLAACVAAGVPPPASRAALPLFDTVAWIGGEQAADRARLLSAFGGEVVRTRDVLAGAAAPALLLVDEFARTTGPREGRALLVALVEHLARRGTFALVATHFDGVAAEAGVPHFSIAGLGSRSLDAHAARDIHAALDAVAKAMDYRIVPVSGEAHAHSDALALAGLLGLDAAIVDRAAALYAGTRSAGAGPGERVTEEGARWSR
jgi:DNA mismatch repair ATPase MutS